MPGFNSVLGIMQSGALMWWCRLAVEAGCVETRAAAAAEEWLRRRRRRGEQHNI
jgi:hypothetical protein